jgi:phospholipase C
VAPQNFSDHPGAPWYGAWYLSEAMDILTKNPEVWKKTIFILCYDENDGYFDHVPPFVPPVPGKPETGRVSPGIDVTMEHLTLEEDLKRKPAKSARGGPVGLGYRVPLVIASPWSRGGAVCSQVFDHTSILMFLEKFVSHKTGKKIEESNISSWRRTICGDLTSTFRPYNGEKMALPKSLARDEFVESIHKAQFKKTPSGYHALTAQEIKLANEDPAKSILPKQEKGTRVSRALPYQLYADCIQPSDNRSVKIRLRVGKDFFGERSAGAPFHVFTYGPEFAHRSYAVGAGDSLEDQWEESAFDNGNYDLKILGPNGFFRSFKGAVGNGLELTCSYEVKGRKLTGNIELSIVNRTTRAVPLEIRDNAYKQGLQTKDVSIGEKVTIVVNSSKSSGWYDTSVLIRGNDSFEQRFAGRVETGSEGVTDPAMG